MAGEEAIDASWEDVSDKRRPRGAPKLDVALALEGQCLYPFPILQHRPQTLQLGAECAAASECNGAPGWSVGVDEARQQLGTARFGEVLFCAARGRLRARHAQADLATIG